MAMRLRRGYESMGMCVFVCIAMSFCIVCQQVHSYVQVVIHWTHNRNAQAVGAKNIRREQRGKGTTASVCMVIESTHTKFKRRHPQIREK